MSPAFRRWSRRTARCCTGSALVEFALVSPLLLVILLGAIDFGRVSYDAMALTNAARAGAQYGSQSVALSNDTAGMQAAAISSSSLDVADMSAAASRRCECAGTAQACNGTCVSTLRIYVMVTTTKVFSTITQFPGFPHTITLTRASHMRVQAP